MSGLSRKLTGEVVRGWSKVASEPTDVHLPIEEIPVLSPRVSTASLLTQSGKADDLIIRL